MAVFNGLANQLDLCGLIANTWKFDTLATWRKQSRLKFQRRGNGIRLLLSDFLLLPKAKRWMNCLKTYEKRQNYILKTTKQSPKRISILFLWTCLCMPKLRDISGRKLVRVFEGFGFETISQKGSHIKMNRAGQILVIPKFKCMRV